MPFGNTANRYPRLQGFSYNPGLEIIRPPPSARGGNINSARLEKLQRIFHGETPPLHQNKDEFSETTGEKQVGPSHRLPFSSPALQGAHCGEGGTGTRNLSVGRSTRRLRGAAGRPDKNPPRGVTSLISREKGVPVPTAPETWLPQFVANPMSTGFQSDRRRPMAIPPRTNGFVPVDVDRDGIAGIIIGSIGITSMTAGDFIP
jgi:hypothetical protein